MTHPPADGSGDRTDLPAAWRREVGAFRAAEQRRRHPLGLHVGVPDGWRESVELPWPEPDWYDAGLRLDVVLGLLSRLDPAVEAAHGWITRPGVPELHDVDLAWCAAARQGWDAHGTVLAGFRAVTRTGWVDVLTGERRAWKRLRLGPGARGPRRPRTPGAGPAPGGAGPD